MNYKFAQIIIKIGQFGIALSLVTIAGLLDGTKSAVFFTLGVLAVCIVLANIKSIVKINPDMKRNSRRRILC